MARSTDRPGTPRYLASVEAARCTETGISAAERALTLNVLGDLQSVPTDLKVPGHIMPAVVHEGVDSGSPLASTARCYVQARHQSLVVAWCDILDENGDLASADYCEALASKLGLVLLHLETCRQLLCLGRGPRIRGYSLHAGNHAMIGWQAPMSGMMDVDPMLAGVR
jgi:3,4-dihydroxy 2-butanone 4-phosphate synthase/GTP cyclohydrolase II